jgi:hypothetical protein
MKKETWIIGIHVMNREGTVSSLQSILTKFGCSIKTRLGLHEIDEARVSPTGIIILELTGDPNEFIKLENELLRVNGLEVKKMIFVK